MPICPKCGGSLRCGTADCLPSAVGSVVKPCADLEGGLWVHVLDDLGNNVPGATALKNGGDGRPTDGSGLAKWDPLPAAQYTAKLDLSADMAKDYELPARIEEAVHVSKGQITYVGFELKRKAVLKVRVVKRTDVSAGFADADVEVVDGPDKPPVAKTAGAAGVHDFLGSFGKVRSGSYKVKATLKPDDAAKFATLKDFGAETTEIRLAPGQTDGVATIEVEARNQVAPKIELEYKVVLLDRKLSAHQPAGELPVKASATKIELSLTECDATQPDQPYKGTHHHTSGGTFTCAGGQVEVFLDAELKKPLPADGKIAGDKLRAGTKLPLWLRGVAAGDFTAKLVLEDPTDRFVTVPKKDAEAPMSVVEMKFIVHQHDKDELDKSACEVDPDVDPISSYHSALHALVLPAQKALSDEDKVKNGRLLHLADGAHHGRARLLFKKLDSWPASADEYTVVFRQEKLDPSKGGGLKLYDKEFEGTEKPLPLKIKVADLKAADLELWLEGSEATKALRNAVLEAGLDRAEGLDPVAHVAKHSGDWGCFSVVKIDADKIKLEYTTPSGGPTAWDEPNKRYFINFKADPDGRKISVSACLSEKLKGVKLHFMLAEDKDNRKAANWGQDLPATWKWKDIEAGVKHTDKAGRKKLLHLSAETNEDGYAKIDSLVLSRFGGDVFHLGVYVDQDPHLAKFVDGHTELEKKKPGLKQKAVAVWRKFWYREVKVAGITVQGFGNASDTYKDVKAVMEAAPVITVPIDEAKGYKAVFKKHMLSFYEDPVTYDQVNNYPGDMGDGLMVGDANEANFLGQVRKDTARPVEIAMLNAHALWGDPENAGDVDLPWQEMTDASFPIKEEADHDLLEPSLDGSTMLRSGTWHSRDWDTSLNSGAGDWSATVATGNFLATEVALNPSRNAATQFEILKPAGLVLGPKTQVKMKLKLRGATAFLGTSYADGIVNAYTPNDEVDFINTINHELGHAFGQVAKTLPAGVPTHPHQYDKSGSHCRYVNDSCLMFESGPQDVHLDRYCPVCHPYVLVQDLFKA